MSQLKFSVKDPDEVLVLSFDFANLLDQGETITAAVFDATDLTDGSDATATLIDGAAEISGSIVEQLVHAGDVGHSYLIRSQVTTSEDRVLVGSATLPVKIGA